MRQDLNLAPLLEVTMLQTLFIPSRQTYAAASHFDSRRFDSSPQRIAIPLERLPLCVGQPPL